LNIGLDTLIKPQELPDELYQLKKQFFYWYTMENKTKIKHLSNEDTILYKKRIKIENTFSWIKKNKRITEINEKTRISYINFVYLAIILIISKRLQI
jgi:IS4 transposase